MAVARDEAEQKLLRDGARGEGGIVYIRPPFTQGFVIIREPGKFPRLVQAAVEDPSLEEQPVRELTRDDDPTLTEPS